MSAKGTKASIWYALQWTSGVCRVASAVDVVMVGVEEVIVVEVVVVVVAVVVVVGGFLVVSGGCVCVYWGAEGYWLCTG